MKTRAILVGLALTIACAGIVPAAVAMSGDAPATVAKAADGAEAAPRLSGRAYFDAVQCPSPPADYEDFTSYPGLVMTGSLEGCWYTKVITSKETPSGVYLESGEEVFVGSLDGAPVGTFATTYAFESKWDPDVSSGVELRGRCQHPIVKGSGTGAFEGATGRLDFKDIIGDPVTYVYRGHISFR